MHLLRGLRRDQAAQCLPELRRRIRSPADPACQRMAAGTIGCEAAAVRQARTSVLQPRRYRGTFSEAEGYSAAGPLARRRNRALDLTKADAIAVTLTPAAHHERIAV